MTCAVVKTLYAAYVRDFYYYLTTRRRLNYISRFFFAFFVLFNFFVYVKTAFRVRIEVIVNCAGVAVRVASAYSFTITQRPDVVRTVNIYFTFWPLQRSTNFYHYEEVITIDRKYKTIIIIYLYALILSAWPTHRGGLFNSYIDRKILRGIKTHRYLFCAYIVTVARCTIY